MKNIVFVVALVFAFVATTSAQKISADKVPAEVLKAFQAKFPSVTNVKWEMEHKVDYEANFKTGGTEQSAVFDKAGKWQETETEIKVGALPAAVTKTLAAKYTDYKIKEAAKVETADKGTLYEVEINKAAETLEVQFSADGAVLNSKKEEKKD